MMLGDGERGRRRQEERDVAQATTKGETRDLIGHWVRLKRGSWPPVANPAAGCWLLLLLLWVAASASLWLPSVRE